MPSYSLTGVRLAGVASAVPVSHGAVAAQAGASEAEIKKIVASTGVESRHIAPVGQTTSDLCERAAERLLAALSWERDSVDLLVFVSQTPDHVLPATACALHGRLGLAKGCMAFDVNLGCSGYVYGLSIVAAHLQAGTCRRALLLVGDTISKIASAADRSVAYLFGDAGTATALERTDSASRWTFVSGTDGTGASHLSVPAGMFRQPSTAETKQPRAREGGNVRSDEQLYMNGAEIFNFTLREVPPMISSLLQAAGWTIDEVDAVVPHQANRFMLDYLAKKMKVPSEKFVVALKHYGNTSSASIPLALCSNLRERLGAGSSKLVLAGFGVGFSWSAVALELQGARIEPVLQV